MTFRRRQFTGWGVLALAALLGAAWLGHLDYAQKISADVLDLIPAGERAPELTLVRQFAGQAEARTVLLVLTGADGIPASTEATRRFAERLGRTPAFEQVVVIGDPAGREALGAVLFADRLTLLFPRWLREREDAYRAKGGAPAGFGRWLAQDAVARFSRFLATPEALAFQDLLSADPLLLMPDAVERLRGGMALAAPGAGGRTAPALVWARLAASPLSEAGQAPAFAAVAQTAAAVRAEFPGFTAADTGVNRFAAASRARIEHEVTWLNGLSLAAVLTIAFAFIRGAQRGLHLVPVVLLSVLGAWVGVTLMFERVHILVFVVGSLLTGVAIDYGFYLFMQPPARPDEDYWEKVRRLAKPLLASCFTTVAGFSLLLFSELPFIRQLGVFVGTGLLGALGTAVVYFSTVRHPFLEARSFRGGQALPGAARRWIRRLLIAAWLVALPGLARLTWRDDIRDLEIPSPALHREDARIRALFGERTDRTAYLTYGATLSEARTALGRLEAWLDPAGAGRMPAFGLGAVVPTDAEYARELRFFREEQGFPEELRAAMAQAGLDATGFDPFFADFAQRAAGAEGADLPAAIGRLQSKLTGPLSLLVHQGQPLSWFVTLAAAAPAGVPPADAHTLSAGQLQTLNRIFTRYRESAMWLSLIGLAMVGAGVLLTYGARDGLRIFAIPCGACLGLFGIFGWVGQPLNLFHLLGAFLGVCLTHNYSIFSATSAYRTEPPPASVRLSALTTAASFGVLALSGIPVVSALGTTVALMVLAALLVIEFEHLAVLGRRP
jgi:predicted exporter